MARYQLTIDFDCTESDTYVQLAASLIADSVEQYGLRRDTVELIDHEAPLPAHTPVQDPEWCELEEGDYPEVFSR